MDEKEVIEFKRIIREMNTKLGTLIALQMIEERPEKVSKRVTLLANLGLGNKEIASILNISEKHVAKEKSLAKRKNG